MKSYSNLSNAEICELLDQGVDLYDLISVDLPEDWNFEEGFEEAQAQTILRSDTYEEIPVPSKKTVAESFLVKIRLHNGRTYEVIKIPVAEDKDPEDQAADIFYHYYKKLNKRHFHIQKPMHRVIRTSIIDELFVERISE